jgi:hypothetical protein
MVPSPAIATASPPAGRVAARVPELDQTEASPAMRLPGLVTPLEPPPLWNLRRSSEGMAPGPEEPAGIVAGRPEVSRAIPQRSVSLERDLGKAAMVEKM